MRALVYHGPGERGWDTVDDPTIIDATDIIVRVDTSTICGTDLHILKGDVPETTPGTVLGHEAVGTVMEIGAAVSTVAPGDHVLMSCVSSCGRCRFCKEGRYGQCQGGGGWIFGHLIDGVQAEYARVPFADNSVYKIPPGLTDEQVLFLADILPTSYEVGVLNGMVSPGDLVAIVGAGPIGLAAILTARLYTPGKIVAIDLAESRLEGARRFGADETINNGDEDAVARIMDMTDGLGADVAFEAVGVPQTFELATDLIRPGGRVANIGVHGKAATLHLEKLWIRDVTVTTGLVDTHSIPQLMRLIVSGRLDPSLFATHRFAAWRHHGRLRHLRGRSPHQRAQGRPLRHRERQPPGRGGRGRSCRVTPRSTRPSGQLRSGRAGCHRLTTATRLPRLSPNFADEHRWILSAAQITSRQRWPMGHNGVTAPRALDAAVDKTVALRPICNDQPP